MSEKQAYVAQVRAALEMYRVRLEEAKAEAVRADEKARMWYHSRIGELQSRLSALTIGMKDLEESQDDSWRLLKRSVENASREFDSHLTGILPESMRTSGPSAEERERKQYDDGT